MKYDSVIKNKIASLATTWMDLEVLSRVKYFSSERQMPYDFTYMCNLTNKIETNGYRELFDVG